MTTLFDWNPSFLTSLASVDVQHRRLVELINELAGQLADGEEPDTVAFSTLYAEIIRYARDHFADEERQMAGAGVDARHVATHRADHQVFMREMMAFRKPGETITHDRAMKLLNYLMHWLVHHILVVDQCMARQVLSIQDGTSPSQAFDQDRQNLQEHSDTAPLLRALGGTLKTLYERNRELQALNRDLEQRVADRTRLLEEANRQLRLLSLEDELTSLPNRRFAVMTLERLWAEFLREGTPLSVLMLDADSFKQVNDHFGHAVGDVVLRELADRLRRAVRQSDIVCRLGGDEFVVICPGCNVRQARELAMRVLESRREIAAGNGDRCWNGGVSIGVAEAAGGMTQPADLLQAADAAMYAAKREGGGCRVSAGTGAG